MNTLDTPFGTVEMKPTSADHVFVDGGVQAINVPDSPAFRPGLMVNGVALSVRLDLMRWADGTWREGREDDRMSQLHALRATRRDWTRVSQMDASLAACRKLREVLVPLAQAWITSPEGEAAIAAAAGRDRDRRIDAKTAEITKLEEELETAREELAVLAADFSVRNFGSLFTLTPRSDAGEAWVAENISGDEVTRWAGGIVVEHRYLDSIVEGITADGLAVR